MVRAADPAANDTLPSVTVPTDTFIPPAKWTDSKYVRQSVVPVSLAVASLTIMAIPDLKYQIQDRMNWNKAEYVNLYDDALRYGPLAANALLTICGVKPRNKLLPQLGMLAASYVLADFVVYRTKTWTKVKRPDSDNFDSFPSQHASMAFVAATLLHREFGHVSPWISVGGYTIATWVAYSRIARNRHYISDVLMGAAIGTLVTNGVYWAYDALIPHLAKKMTLSPYISAEQTGIYLCYNF
jgi:membrane-associated phospholipid phosphatase